MRHYPRGDPIRVRATSDGRPVAFSWRGHVHRVATVEDIREPRLDWWSATGEVHRRYFVVSTHQGLICEIYQDLTTDHWRMSAIFD